MTDNEAEMLKPLISGSFIRFAALQIWRRPPSTAKTHTHTHATLLCPLTRFLSINKPQDVLDAGQEGAALGALQLAEDWAPRWTVICTEPLLGKLSHRSVSASSLGGGGGRGGWAAVLVHRLVGGVGEG